MKIEWKIEKKRGNWRPLLDYACVKEEWELELAVAEIKMPSAIPVPPDPYKKFCLPDQDERRKNWTPKDFYTLITPKAGEISCRETLKLPFRESGEYPEVEESFRRLRDEYEREFKRAYDSLPLNLAGSVDMSPEVKSYAAPGILAKKMLGK